MFSSTYYIEIVSNIYYIYIFRFKSCVRAATVTRG